MNKRGAFLNIAVYMCKCGSETFDIETDVDEFIRNVEARGHPLCGNWTVDDLMDMLKKQNILTVKTRGDAEKRWGQSQSMQTRCGKVAVVSPRKSPGMLSMKASEMASDKLREICSLLACKNVTFFVSKQTSEDLHKYRYRIYTKHEDEKQAFPIFLNPPLCYSSGQTIIWDQEKKERLDIAVRSGVYVRIKGPRRGSRDQLQILEGWVEVSDIRWMRYAEIPVPHLTIRTNIDTFQGSV